MNTIAEGEKCISPDDDNSFCIYDIPHNLENKTNRPISNRSSQSIIKPPIPKKPRNIRNSVLPKSPDNNSTQEKEKSLSNIIAVDEKKNDENSNYRPSDPEEGIYDIHSDWQTTSLDSSSCNKLDKASTLTRDNNPPHEDSASNSSVMVENADQIYVSFHEMNLHDENDDNNIYVEPTSISSRASPQPLPRHIFPNLSPTPGDFGSSTLPSDYSNYTLSPISNPEQIEDFTDSPPPLPPRPGKGLRSSSLNKFSRSSSNSPTLLRHVVETRGISSLSNARPNVISPLTGDPQLDIYGVCETFNNSFTDVGRSSDPTFNCKMRNNHWNDSGIETIDKNMEDVYSPMRPADNLKLSRDSCCRSSSQSESENNEENDYWDPATLAIPQSISTIKRSTDNYDCPDTSNRKSKLENIVEEVLSTERSYLKKLKLLEETYKQLLSLVSNRETEVKSIFKDVSSLKQLHELLEQKLASLIAGGNHIELYRIFIDKEIQCSLKMYKPFFHLYQSNQELLCKLLKSDHSFSTVCLDIQTNAENPGIDIPTYYKSISARLFQLQMLLDRYSSEVQKSESTAESVQPAIEACDKMRELVRSFDIDVQNVKLYNEAFEYHAMLDNCKQDIRNWTKFLKKGPVTKISCRRAARRRPRHLLLFNEYLYLTYPMNRVGKYYVKNEISVISILEICSIEEEDVEDAEYIFRIKATSIIIDLAFESDAEMLEWQAEIINAKQALEEKINPPLSTTKKGTQAPVWIKDELASQCMRCCSKFAVVPISKRRHHCRICGWVVCDKCSQMKTEIPYLNNKLERVCDFCYIQNNPSKAETMKRRMTITREIDSILVKGKLKYETFSEEQGWSPSKSGFCSFTDTGFLLIKKCKEDISPLYKELIISFDVKNDEAKSTRIELHHQNNKTLKYGLTLKNEDMKRQWVEEFQKIISFYHSDNIYS